MKQVSFTLIPGQAEKYKSLVTLSVQSKVLRQFLVNEFKLPEDLSVLQTQIPKGVKPDKFLFNAEADLRLNDYVKTVKARGIKVNRSSMMRLIIQSLIEKLEGQQEVLPQQRKLRHSMFYFEFGTKDVLFQLISFRDRNAVIERFILDEYVPGRHLTDKPEQPEQMRVSIAAAAFEKLDNYVKKINQKGVSRTALMRDVVNQIISKRSNSDAAKLIAEKRLEYAMIEYKQLFSGEELKEKAEKYGGK